MTALEFEEMLKKGIVIEKPEFKLNNLDTSEYYQHIDGRIIIFLLSSPNEITVFKSFEEFEKVKKIAIGGINAKDKSLLSAHQSKLKHFNLNLIEIERNHVAKELKIDTEYLDYSVESLKIVDVNLKLLQITQSVFFKQFYFPLFIYSGEVLRRAINGKWHLRKSFSSIEPIIIVKDRKILYFKSLYKEALEHYENFPVESSVKANLFIGGFVT